MTALATTLSIALVSALSATGLFFFGTTCYGILKGFDK